MRSFEIHPTKKAIYIAICAKILVQVERYPVILNYRLTIYLRLKNDFLLGGIDTAFVRAKDCPIQRDPVSYERR